ncbi:ImuA family protein, partial [Aurantimonas sp. VKM B-3413]|uniref:ImuA family protein n=1 Tax=Aurantimonas sp. VKM B-3413 TaxID=2779401 RepID=UPI001E2CB18C
PHLRHRAAARLSLGAPEIDAALGGGLIAAGLTEIHLDEARDGGTLAGFALALAVRLGASPLRPLLWIADGAAFAEAGLPYGPGLAGFGLDPAALVLVRARRLADAAWAGEEAAACSAIRLAILEVRGNPSRLALEGTRRLHLRAREAGVPLLLLRQSARAEATAAPMRLRIRPDPAAPVADLAGEARLIGHPVFSVTVEKSRDGRPQTCLLEWNPDERRFGLVRPAGAEPLSRRPAGAAVDGPDPARDARTVVAFDRRAS